MNLYTQEGLFGWKIYIADDNPGGIKAKKSPYFCHFYTSAFKVSFMPNPFPLMPVHFHDIKATFVYKRDFYDSKSI